MKRATMTLALTALLSSVLATTAPGAQAAAAPCELSPRALCFDLESASASLSTAKAGAHPDLTLSFAFNQDPATPANAFGLRETYALTRDLHIDTPPGFVGDPNVLGASQQCTMQELVGSHECPNGSQIGISNISLAGGWLAALTEPLYMMTPPEGSDIVARLGFVAAVFPSFIDIRVRSQNQEDFGLSFDATDIPPAADLVGVETTTWGVPAAPVHDTERCTPNEAQAYCTVSPPRPPGSRPLAFLTNPTRCGAPLSLTVSADSWVEPHRLVSKSGEFPTITGCDKVPFNPSLFVEPTSHRAAAPTGLELSFRLPAPEGVGVLESSQLRDLRIDFPPGMAVNPASADGLATCSAAEVGFGTATQSHCPDGAKLGETEFDIPALPRRMRGAIYLREPEPGHLFRVWVVADDLGVHLKLPGELEIDERTGQIHSVVMEIPQAPVREVRLLLKSGFRAPLVNPQRCGTYLTHWEFTPWSGTGAVSGDTPMKVSEGCDTGAFNPKLSAGTTDPTAGRHSPFVFTLQREDGEQSAERLDIALPRGFAASFAGIGRCEGAQAASGDCPPASRVGRVLASSGAGPNPLWVPEPGKDPTAVYLGGPYKGAPLSVIAAVPAQAGPFDLGKIVVRSAIYVDPATAQASVVSDPIPQIIQGIPIPARTIEVILDRPNFTLNPTSCEQKSVGATVTSSAGAIARPSAYYQASGCASLGFKPRLSLKLRGGTRRGAFPALTASFRPRPGDANAKSVVVRLPHSAFLEQGHFRTICTRVQYAASGGGGAGCPAASAYGHVIARTPLFDFPLEGPVYLRSSDHNLPDLVLSLHGPPSLPIQIEAVGRIDSVKGGIRSSFEAIPDAPITEVLLEMEGGQKGLIVNSTNVCASASRAEVALAGQNGRHAELHPKVQARCPKRHRRKGAHR